MSLTPPASPDERRAAAHASRLQRTRRIAQLRRQVLATALATFALAFGLIAFDGSMGQGQASSANAAAAPSGRPTTDDLGAATSGDTFDDSGSADDLNAAGTPTTGSSSDALTTSQS
jgi:hypothetical protein